jgi:hypothetical protein
VRKDKAVEDATSSTEIFELYKKQNPDIYDMKEPPEGIFFDDFEKF